jgi:hypothetical protein
MASTAPTRDGDQPQATPESQPARANRAGSKCPAWCTVDHAKIQTHMSDAMTSGPWGEPRVRIVQFADSRYSSEPQAVTVSKTAAFVQLRHSGAKDLADLLEELADGCTPDRLRNLADEVRTAASVIDPLRQLSATVTEMSANHEAGQ